MTRARMAALAIALTGALVLTAAPASADEWIELREDGFQPEHVTVDAGETLHFSSSAGQPWSVTADGGEFDSGQLPPSGAYSMKLSVPGTHEYRSGDITASITVRARTLPGPAADLATDRIPDLPFPSPEASDVAVHDRFAVEASTTRIMVAFEEDATVEQANAALAEADVRIIGGLPTAGILLVSAGKPFEYDRFARLDEAIALLREAPGVAAAAMSTGVASSAVPRRTDDDTAGTGNGWDWDNPFFKGNWGLVWSRFPEAWNLLETIRRKHPTAIAGIVDKGFGPHKDLLNLQVPPFCEGGTCTEQKNEPSAHGNHVAGVIGAAYDNDVGADGRSLGVAGASPVARMYGYPANTWTFDPLKSLRSYTLVDTQLALFERILRTRPQELRVLNYSMAGAVFNGPRWQHNYGSQVCGPGARDDDVPKQPTPMEDVCTPNNLDEWLREMANLGRLTVPVARMAAQRGVMIVQAAGNDGTTFCPDGHCRPIDAAARTEFGWVSRHWDAVGEGLPDPVIVAQSIDNDGRPRSDTTFGGHIAAPGDAILSTVLDDRYATMGGSSLAAAHVTGLIAYLLADNPKLGIAEIRRLVLGWAGGRPTSGTLDFTWTMPDRLNRDVLGDGMVDYRTDVQQAGFRVRLDACDASLSGGRMIGTYVWTANGEAIGFTAECELRWRAPAEGTYDVELTAIGAEGEQESVNKQVKVEDLLIVSVGDSIASGEGVPDVEGLRGAQWQFARCHRSAFAGPALAARWIEAADARTSVSFLHLACSGARIEGDDGGRAMGFPGVGGLLTPYEGITDDNDSPCAMARMDSADCLPPQLDEARARVGDRKVDALLLSIGANDMWFSKILIDCLVAGNDCSTGVGNGIFLNRILLLEQRYAKLAAAIRERFGENLPPERVVITQYPDPTTDETGAVDLTCGLASGITDAEARWAAETVIPALNQKVADAAAAHGWTLAPGIPGDFRTHGYCSANPWIVDLSGTFVDQGGKDGAFHPNKEGHSAYAKRIIESVRDVAGLGALTRQGPPRDTAPRLNAYRAVAGNGPASRVVDVSDPSKDGNRRVERTVAPDGTVTEREDTTLSRYPGDRTDPDGQVDMRDFRRYRDAWLQACLTEGDGCPGPSEISLDGDDLHPKRDLNFDGCVTGDPLGCGAREHWFSRFDFNADRLIDPAKKALVPWQADGTPAQGRADARLMSDLDLLASAWTGSAEGWTKDDLPDLLRSGDLEVHAGAVLDEGAAKAELQVRERDGAAVGPKRTVRRRDGHAVMTVPVASTAHEYELVTTATTDDGAMSSVSDPFTLAYGEDRLVAVCPDLSVRATPARLPARGTSTVTATLHPCHGRETADRDVGFTLDQAGDATLTPGAPKTDAQGRATATFEAGTLERTYTVKVSVPGEDGAEPLEAEVEIEVVPLITVRYVWRQTVEDWQESGSTRWGPFDPLMPDCTAPGMEYCIDAFQVGMESQAPGGVLRSGTLTGGGDRFDLTEQVSNTGAASLSSWTLSFPDGRTEQGGRRVDWFVTDPQAYTDHAVQGLRAEDEPEGIRLRGMQAVGDLPYHYAMNGVLTQGTVDPQEIHGAKNGYLLIPQNDRKIRFAAQPEEDVVFPRGDDGFEQYESCGRLEADLTPQPGYYVAGPSEYIPGAVSVGRKTEYAPGDRPMPVGPGHLDVRYAFAAVVGYAGQPLPEPVLPECSAANPPDAAFDVIPPGDGPAKEGRQIAFRDRSTDPDNDIVETEWDFGDGTTASGVAPHHIFGDDGTYTVTLTVTDAKGNADTATKEVVVENEPPEAEIDDAAGKSGEVRIDFRILDPGAADREQLDWRITSPDPAFPVLEGTDHAGVWWRGPISAPLRAYAVTLTVTDKDGATATDEAVIAITATEPPEDCVPWKEGCPLRPYVTCDPAVELDPEERQLLDLVNEYREANGVPPVGLSPILIKAAERHADDMAANDFLRHEGSDGSGPGERAWEAGYPLTARVSENLAEGDTAWDAMWGWRGSTAGHNEAMLDPRWRALGIARANGSRWRWATSYGTDLDCPTLAPPDPPEAAFTFVARAEEAEEPPLHAPTVAVALDRERARAGRPLAVTNRSRDAAGQPIAATLTLDGDEPIELAPGETRPHAFAGSEWPESHRLRLSATDEGGRTAELEREVWVDPVLPPHLSVRHSDQLPVAGRPYTVEVEVFDQATWEPAAGLELTFTLGATTVTATSDAAGVATASIPLPETGGPRTIEIAFAGTDDYPPASEQLGLEVIVNHAPVADAGGPYVTGEGGTLMLDGTGSADEDPGWFDEIAAYEWDLDGDGAYDDAQGRLPAPIEGDALNERVCGGPCLPGREYPVTLRVTDSHGDHGTDAATVRFVADFDLLVGGGTKTIVPGQSNSFAVTVIGSRSYDKPVTLSATGLPPGVTASFSKSPVRPTDVSVLTLTGASTLSNGTYPLRVTGTDGEITKEVSDEITVAFGLIPICRGRIAGVVTDQTTGAPVEGALVTMFERSVTTDASGRYDIKDVPLGFNNAPLHHSLTFALDGYWPAFSGGQAMCGAVTRVDAALLEVRTGTVRGRVVDRETGEPLPDATVDDSVDVGEDGRFELQAELGPDNTERFWSGQAEAPGYWFQNKGAMIAEDRLAEVLYELVRKCTGTLWRGRVLYGPDRPAAGSVVDVYITSQSIPDVTVVTDELGGFQVDRPASLGHDNSPASYRAAASVPAEAPPGTEPGTGSLVLDACGDVAEVDITLRTPNHGSIEGRVTDEETGAPMPAIVVQTCMFACIGVWTDADGRYRFDDVDVGSGDQTRMFRSVQAEPDGYYPGQASGWVDAGQTTTLDFAVLRRHHGALEARVVDAVTGAPIAGAQVAQNESCGGLCVFADRNGEARRTGIELNHRNVPRTLGLTAAADGYWPQAKSVTFRAHETAAVEYRLQPECEPARVTGTVVNAETQTPIEGAQVGGAFAGSATTDAQGRFVLDSVRPSTGNNPRQVLLTASASGFHSQSKQITVFCGARIRVEFGSRTTRTATIAGTVTDGDTGAPLAGAFVGTEYGATATTDAQGGYRLTGVPLGDLDADREWAVMVHPPGYKPMSKPVTVRADAESRLDFAFTTANAAPSAQDGQVALDEDTSARLTVAGSDPDGDGLTYHVMRWPQHGDLRGRLPDLTYEPDTNYNGPDRFEFLVSDGVASSEHATVDLTVRPANDHPRAVDDRFGAVPGETLRIPVADLLANDVEIDDEPKRLTAVRSNHLEATVALEDDEVVFTPPPGWDEDLDYAFFDYTITDAAGVSSTAWVYVRVHGAAAPRCSDASFTVRQGETLEAAVACTDANGDPLTYALAGGSVALAADGSFAYTPPDGFLGETRFTFTASDGALTSEPATATITVVRDNAAPACADVAVAGDEDEPVEIVLPCTDADGDALGFRLDGEPAHGTLARTGNGEYRYTPDRDWSGTDTFGFAAADAHASSAAAVARIQVRPANDLPACRAVTLTTDAGTAGHADPACDDVEGDALAYEVVEQGAKGTASVAGGRLRFVPAPGATGRDEFRYAASDGTGRSAPARVAVTIRAVPQPGRAPVAAADALAVDEDGVLSVPAAALLANDAGEEPLTVAAVGDARQGAVSLSGATVRYAPAADFHGTAGFAYTVADSGGATATGAVTVTVRPVNDAPEAGADAAETLQDSPVDLDAATLLANDGDADGDALALAGAGEAVDGTVAVEGGRVRFTPRAGFHGTARFSYSVADGRGGTGAGSVAVTVHPRTATGLLLSCTDRSIVLEDVVPAGRRVRLLGVADPRHAGARAQIRFLGTGKVVARPVIGADGRFRATAPMPGRRLRSGNRARYTASVGGERSLDLKLMRRMLVSDVRAAGRRVIVTGRVTGPLARRRRDRVIEVQRRRSCDDLEVVARVWPRRNGRFRAVIPAPAGERAAVYRLRTTVPRSRRGGKLSRTFTLPRAVDL